jgi:hypothetical protein
MKLWHLASLLEYESIPSGLVPISVLPNSLLFISLSGIRASLDCKHFTNGIGECNRIFASFPQAEQVTSCSASFRL